MFTLYLAQLHKAYSLYEIKLSLTKKKLFYMDQ